MTTLKPKNLTELEIHLMISRLSEEEFDDFVKRWIPKGATRLAVYECRNREKRLSRKLKESLTVQLLDFYAYMNVRKEGAIRALAIQQSLLRKGINGYFEKHAVYVRKQLENDTLRSVMYFVCHWLESYLTLKYRERNALLTSQLNEGLKTSFVKMICASLLEIRLAVDSPQWESTIGQPERDLMRRISDRFIESMEGITDENSTDRNRLLIPKSLNTLKEISYGKYEGSNFNEISAKLYDAIAALAQDEKMHRSELHVAIKIWLESAFDYSCSSTNAQEGNLEELYEFTTQPIRLSLKHRLFGLRNKLEVLTVVTWIVLAERRGDKKLIRSICKKRASDILRAVAPSDVTAIGDLLELTPKFVGLNGKTNVPKGLEELSSFLKQKHKSDDLKHNSRAHFFLRCLYYKNFLKYCLDVDTEINVQLFKRVRKAIEKDSQLLPTYSGFVDQEKFGPFLEDLKLFYDRITDSTGKEPRPLESNAKTAKHADLWWLSRIQEFFAS